MKKIFIFFISLIALFLLSHSPADCGEKKEKVEIVFWTGWSGPELETMQGIVDKFNNSQDRIHCRLVTLAGFYQKVRIAFAGGDVPDLLSCIWAEELAAYAMRDVLEPLDDYMAKSGRDFSKEYMPGIWKMFQYEKKCYALSMTTNGDLYFFNKKQFRELGLPTEYKDVTMEQFEKMNELSLKTDENGNIERYGSYAENLLVQAYVFGGGWYDPETKKITATRPENLRALEWIRKEIARYDKNKIQRFQKSFNGWINSANCPFYTGRTTMYRAGEYMVEHLKRYAPDIEYGWFPYPSPEGGRKNCSIVGGSVFSIPSQSKHKEEAWELLNFLTSPDSIREFCMKVHNLPPLIGVAKEPVFTNDPVYKDLSEIMSGENVFGPPGMPVWIRYMDEIKRAEESVVYGGGDPKAALEYVQKVMERELSRILLQKGNQKNDNKK